MGNKTALKQHFPMLRDREEILQEITKSNRLSRLYATWVPECKEEFKRQPGTDHRIDYGIPTIQSDV